MDLKPSITGAFNTAHKPIDMTTYRNYIFSSCWARWKYFLSFCLNFSSSVAYLRSDISVGSIYIPYSTVVPFILKDPLYVCVFADGGQSKSLF